MRSRLRKQVALRAGRYALANTTTLSSAFLSRKNAFRRCRAFPLANRYHVSPMFVRLTKQFHFEAAHFLPSFPPEHKCRRMHGHSFRFDVVVAGEVDAEKGYLIDYGDIRKAVDPVVAKLDHYLLNEIDGLSNPTAERLAKWLWDRIRTQLPSLSLIRVYETCTSSCEYEGR